LLGDRGAADDGAALEHDGALAGASEIGGRNEAVVPAPDDDRVVLIRRAGWHGVTLPNPAHERSAPAARRFVVEGSAVPA
jgi:hypothetical protein